MGDLRLYATRINDVRDMFSASGDLATRLREQALAAFPAPAPKKFGRLGQLGPMFRRPVETFGVSPTVPNQADVDMLLLGQFVDPERIIAAWRLVEWWLECGASGKWRSKIEEQTINDLDFRLAMLDVPATFGLRKVFRGALGIPLQPFPGMIAGYTKHEQVVAMMKSWAPVLDQLDAEVGELANNLAGWLTEVMQLGDNLDLVAIYS